MNTRLLGFVAWMALLLVAYGQGDAVPTKEGLYRGTLTISSPQFGASAVPVKKVYGIVSRVTPSSGGRIRAIIRGVPQPSLIDPIPQFLLEYDVGDGVWYVFEQLPNGSTVNFLVPSTKFLPSSFSFESVRTQTFNYENVSSTFTARFVLRRVGP